MSRLYDEFGSPVPCGCCHRLHASWTPEYEPSYHTDGTVTAVVPVLTGLVCPCGAHAPAALVLFTERVLKGLTPALTDETTWPAPEPA